MTQCPTHFSISRNVRIIRPDYTSGLYVRKLHKPLFNPLHKPLFNPLHKPLFKKVSLQVPLKITNKNYENLKIYFVCSVSKYILVENPCLFASLFIKLKSFFA